MACFVVPVIEAVITTVAVKVIESREKKAEILGATGNNTKYEIAGKIPFSRKLRWLSNMLWGGSALLAFEHIWHGEVVPWLPFLTAVGNPGDTAAMLRERSTVGIAMAGLVTAIWFGMLGVSVVMEKRINIAHENSN